MQIGSTLFSKIQSKLVHQFNWDGNRLHRVQTSAVCAFSLRLCLSCSMVSLSGLVTTAPVCAESGSEPMSTGSVLMASHVNKAADFYEKGDFVRAKEEFRAVIGFAPNAVEPYEGLLACSEKIKDWQEVAFAAEKIAVLSPERTRLYEFDYGTALFNLNRYDEAVPHLKSALATADIPQPLFKPIKIVPPELNGTISPIDLFNLKQAPDTHQAQSQGQSGTRLPIAANRAAEIEIKENSQTVTSDSSLDESKLANFVNAIRSEFIGIAEYRGYDKNDDIRFNSPPATHWHIDKILKGPPLNKALPLRYDFHPLEVKEQPADWHFAESKLPKIGSKWILFIEFAYPEGPRKLFTTFDGSYGRQPATERNLNELDRLLEEHKMRNQGL